MGMLSSSSVDMENRAPERTNPSIVSPLFVLIFTLLMLSVAVPSIAYPPIATEFYGNITDNATAASSGTVITAYDPDGVLCGSFTMVQAGYFGLLSCMGDDTTTTIDEGASTSDAITFYTDGQPTRRFFNFTWISASFHFVYLDRNYPPSLIIDDLLNSTEDIAFYHDANATDPNGDPINFTTNSSFFTINPSTGIISFTPTNDDVGVHPINVTVTDFFGLTDSKIITFIVVNVNDRPFFDPPLENLSAHARDLFTYDINVTDIDVGDVLTYYDNSTLFNISPTTGMINFTPIDEQIGNYSINITVCDDSGAFDDCTSGVILFEVLFNNHPPILTPIGNQEWYVGLRATLDMNATDADNDSFTFHTNATFFTINNITGRVSFIPSVGDIGTHIVRFWVDDGFYIVSETVSITVFAELFCGDGRCSSVLIGESCFSCPTDCGTCPPGDGEEGGDSTDGQDGGGGGGGGSGEGETTETGETGGQSIDSGSGTSGAAQQQKRPFTCTQNWTCTDWGACVDGVETRICTDTERCLDKQIAAIRSGDTFNILGPEKPLETRACGPEATCSDGIQNQDEEGIDCGGSCTPCLFTPITQYPTYPFKERPGLLGCGDGICALGEECSCMQDCAVFPERFFRYFSFLFILLFAILLVLNYTLYRLGVYKKGKMLYRFKRLAMFLSFLLFILIVFSLYLWLYGSCIYIVQRLLWLPLLLILVIPMMTYELLVYFGYVESRKIRRMKMLIRRHEDELERLARIEEHGLALVEIDVSRRLFSLYDAKHPLMRQVPEKISLYNVLIRLARHRVSGEDAVELEKKAEMLFGRILSAQPFLDEVSRDKSLVPLQRGMDRLKTFFHEKRENEAALRRMKTEIVKERKAGKTTEKPSMDADKDPDNDPKKR